MLLAGNGDILLVNSVFFNVGQTDASGYDFTLNYVLNTDNMGRFEFNGLATWLETYDRVFTVGGAVNDLIGTDATGSGDDFYIEWKGRISLDWRFRDWSVYIGANYTGGYDDAAVGQLDRLPGLPLQPGRSVLLHQHEQEALIQSLIT